MKKFLIFFFHPVLSLELPRTVEEEDGLEFHLSKETATPEKEVNDHMDIDTYAFTVIFNELFIPVFLIF